MQRQSYWNGNFIDVTEVRCSDERRGHVLGVEDVHRDSGGGRQHPVLPLILSPSVL